MHSDHTPAQRFSIILNPRSHLIRIRNLAPFLHFVMKTRVWGFPFFKAHNYSAARRNELVIYNSLAESQTCYSECKKPGQKEDVGCESIT